MASRDELLKDIESALSGLNRIHADISETRLSDFSRNRDGVEYVITQLIGFRNGILDERLDASDVAPSAGVGRTIVEDWIDHAHPLSSLCMKIEAQYNQQIDRARV